MRSSALLKKLAEQLGENSLEWELVGLLHDLDFDETRNNMSEHGLVAVEKLKGRLPEYCLYAIKSHDHRTSFKPKSKLDKALIIADSLTIVIEEMRDQLLSVESIEEEIERVAVKKSWLKKNILKCKEIGINKPDLLKLMTAIFLS